MGKTITIENIRTLLLECRHALYHDVSDKFISLVISDIDEMVNALPNPRKK